MRRWEHLPKRSAGYDFTRADYSDARQRAEETARATLGDELWEELGRLGYLDVPSRRYRGVTYRLRVGRRIEVLTEEGVRHLPVVSPRGDLELARSAADVADGIRARRRQAEEELRPLLSEDVQCRGVVRRV